MASPSSASSPTAPSLAALPHPPHGIPPFTFLELNGSTIATPAMAPRHLRANVRSLTDDETPCFAFAADNPIKWTSEQGELRVNGFSFHLKGINWQVYETSDPFLAGHTLSRPLYTRTWTLRKEEHRN
jgi:hypothetical protein